MSPRRSLAIVDHRRPELETCAYCPKLCRSACPVADAEASDTVTPWGQMSSVYAVARGAREATPDYAALPWACAGCFGCRERCDHRNRVVETLYDARAEYAARGLAPPAAVRVREGFAARRERLAERVEELKAQHGYASTSRVALLLGCDYAQRLPREVDDAVRAAQALFGPVRLLAECCGLPLTLAGDPEGARAARERVLSEAAGVGHLIAVDSGCAWALRDAGVVPFARAAAAALGSRSRPPPFGAEPLRYHDPCLLGRGLGEYDAPRVLVAQASENPVEFSYRREQARCSGGGGLLPLTRPQTAASIANARAHEHARLGGGTVVTACAQSLRRFREAGVRALDLVSVVLRLAEP